MLNTEDEIEKVKGNLIIINDQMLILIMCCCCINVWWGAGLCCCRGGCMVSARSGREDSAPLF